MALETVSTKKNRVYQRKFDHDEARQLRIMEGWGWTQLAERYGVSLNAVKRVCDREFRLEFEARAKAHLMSGVCKGCGGPTVLYISEGRHGYCRKCDGERRQTRFRFDELGNLAAVRCATCRTWKDAGLFAHDRASAREKHEQCRECSTKARQNYRERHKVPCVGCGAPCLPPSEKGTNGAAFPRCIPCYKFWRHTPEGKAAASAASKKAISTRRARQMTAPAKPKPLPSNRCPKGHQRAPGRKTCDECQGQKDEG